MAIYAVIEERCLGASDYKYYHKLENAKKELKRLKKEHKKYKNEKIEELTEDDCFEDKFKYGGFWITGEYSGCICGEYQNAVYIEEIQTED